MGDEFSYMVTGGAGFIGSSLCRRLIEKGARVTCIDNLVSGRTENISDLLENDRIKFYIDETPFELYVSRKAE